MQVAMVFKLVYDRDRDGPLKDFREKYTQLREHIDRMQAKGLLPRGDIRWSLETKKSPPPSLPDGPAAVARFESRTGPVYGSFYPPRIIHLQCTRLDSERIAI